VDPGENAGPDGQTLVVQVFGAWPISSVQLHRRFVIHTDLIFVKVVVWLDLVLLQTPRLALADLALRFLSRSRARLKRSVLVPDLACTTRWDRPTSAAISASASRLPSSLTCLSSKADRVVPPPRGKSPSSALSADVNAGAGRGALLGPAAALESPCERFFDSSAIVDADTSCLSAL